MEKYTFKKSLAKSYESTIDSLLIKQGYSFREATMEEQRQGVDRILVDGTKLDYKAESRVTDTGNYFIETLSVSKSNKPGWIHYSESKYIIYYLPLEKKLLWVPLQDMKDALPMWESRHKTKTCENKGYFSAGIVVPRAEIEKLAVKSFNV